MELRRNSLPRQRIPQGFAGSHDENLSENSLAPAAVSSCRECGREEERGSGGGGKYSRAGRAGRLPGRADLTALHAPQPPCGARLRPWLAAARRWRRRAAADTPPRAAAPAPQAMAGAPADGTAGGTSPSPSPGAPVAVRSLGENARSPAPSTPSVAETADGESTPAGRPAILNSIRATDPEQKFLVKQFAARFFVPNRTSLLRSTASIARRGGVRTGYA
jgi:hypothetical protein